VSLRVGDWVEVRSPAEVLSTLDERGCLDGLPFMPQQVDRCGQQFRVRKRAHKLCDTVNETGARRMRNSVFLDDAPCDGRVQGGCEMECTIVWKEAWLRPVNVPSTIDEAQSCRDTTDAAARLYAIARLNTQPPDKQKSNGEPIYSCQATQMPVATSGLSPWDLRQYVEDVTSGNARPVEILEVVLLLIYKTIESSGIGLGSAMRWCYDTVQRLRGGSLYPNRLGRLPRQSQTPSRRLDLIPGEVVRVRSHAEILETVNEDLLNRGMSFHPDMVRHCGRIFRVSKRPARLINEKTGQLLVLKNECVVLQGAECGGRFTKPLLCPRGMSPYWREIWLERDTSQAATPKEE
jgi:hypothetical protein